MVTRREFIKTGMAGGAALTLGGWWFAASRDDEVEALLGAVTLAMLAGVLPQEAAARDAAVAGNIKGMRRAIAGLGTTAQSEVAQLFGLLTFAPGRVMVAGVWHSWDRMSTAEAERFLADWRGSSLDLLKSAYAALHDIALGAWYGDDAHWAAIGYPGPPLLK